MRKIALLLTSLFMSLQLQAELKILTVDMGELYNNYSKAQEAQSKFNASVETAQEEIRAMIDEGRRLAKEYQEKIAKANNPALTEEARKKFGEEAVQLQEDIRRKETEVNNYKSQTDATLAARHQSIVKLHLDEISEVVRTVAQERGADLVLNTNGLGVVFSADALDVTSEVMGRINAQ